MSGGWNEVLRLTLLQRLGHRGGAKNNHEETVGEPALHKKRLSRQKYCVKRLLYIFPESIASICDGLDSWRDILTCRTERRNISAHSGSA
jgi:hypothetical protein